ncbi:hypothetical protein HK405_003689, partial [Cladochytrium tenue]
VLNIADFQPATIAQVLSQTPSSVRFVAPPATRRFLLRGVRVIDHMPGDLRDFARRKDSCDCGQPTPVLRFVFSLLLHDGTAFLPVVLANEEAEQFLNGLAPRAYREEPEAATQALRFVLSTLWTDGDDATIAGDPPRVSGAAQFACAIESFAVGDAGAWLVRYRVVQTRLRA